MATTKALTDAPDYHPRVAINVRVINNLGEIKGEAAGIEVNRLCERASATGMPGLGYVDEYDDTVFNLSQMRLVIPELERLAESAPPNEAHMVEQLLSLAGMVSATRRAVRLAVRRSRPAVRG
jgi:hypothetical protein